MTNNIYFKPRTDKPKVVITDYDYGNINVESEILEAVGAEVIALQAKSEEDLFGVAPSCAAMINQYAKIGRKTISLMERCEVIARYGIGVDIVDVDEATSNGILVTNVQNYCTEELQIMPFPCGCPWPVSYLITIVQHMLAFGNGKVVNQFSDCVGAPWGLFLWEKLDKL